MLPVLLCVFQTQISTLGSSRPRRRMCLAAAWFDTWLALRRRKGSVLAGRAERGWLVGGQVRSGWGTPILSCPVQRACVFRLLFWKGKKGRKSDARRLVVCPFPLCLPRGLQAKSCPQIGEDPAQSRGQESGVLGCWVLDDARHAALPTLLYFRDTAQKLM